MKAFITPAEVVSFNKDSDALQHEHDLSKWSLTDKWLEIFQQHYNNILPLAKSGNAVVQYTIAIMYMVPYLHKTHEEHVANYENDSAEMTYWLEKAAKQGILGAIDILIVEGIGAESDRLRKLRKSQNVPNEKSMEEWQSNLQSLYEIAYGKKRC